MKKLVINLVAAIALASVSMTSGAAAVSTSNGTLNFSWSNLLGNGVNISGTGTANANIVAGNLVLSFNVTNNTNLLNSGDNTALVSLGFGISPNATSVVLSTPIDNGVAGGGGDLNDAGLVTQQGSTNIPSLANIEICAFAVLSGNCSGGSVNEGVQAGQSDQFTLTLAGNWGSTVDIAPIGFKFQGTYGSYEFYSSSSTSTTSTTGGGNSTSGSVPEPGAGSLALLGLGLLGAGFGLRRKQSSSSI